MYIDQKEPSKDGYVRKVDQKEYVVYIQVKMVMYERLIRKSMCVHPSKDGYVRKVDQKEYVVYIQVKMVMYERLIRKSMLCTSK